MTEYKQACPEGPCFICVNGTLKGNGSAQTNPTPRQGVAGTSALWEAAVRKMEDPV